VERIVFYAVIELAVRLRGAALERWLTFCAVPVIRLLSRIFVPGYRSDILDFWLGLCCNSCGV
jgi:hypothetical protein